MFYKNKTTVYVSIMVILITAQVVFLFINNSQSKPVLRKKIVKQTQKIVPSNPIPPTDTSASPTPTEASFTIEFDESFTGSDKLKSEITQKVLLPYSDYYKVSDDRAGLQLLSVRTNPRNDSEKPYTLSSTFANGRNETIFIKAKKGVIQWWLPDCIYNCPFPPGFEAKYPEIIKFFK